MTAYAIVRDRAKPGRDRELFNRLREINAITPQAPGFRRRTVIGLGGRLYCTVLEWESFEALADGRPRNRIIVDAIGEFLENRGETGVNFAVSGEAVQEWARPEVAPPGPIAGRPRAWNVLRYHLKRENRDAADPVARTALPPAGAAPPDGLRKTAVVKIGDRGYCVLGEWESYDQLTVGGPAIIERLEMFRDSLERVPGGLGVIQASAGTVVDENLAAE